MGIMQAGQTTVAPQEVAEPLLQASPLFAPISTVADQQAEVDIAEEPTDALDRLVLEILHTVLPDREIRLRTPPIAAAVRQIRQHVAVALSTTAITVPVALWLVVRGVLVYIATSRPECNGPLRAWLLGFLLMHLPWPLCIPSVTLLLLGWCVGAVVLLREPDGCKAIWAFLLEALVLQTMQATMLLISAVSVLLMRPVVRRLHEMLGDNGTDPEVVRNITILQPSEVAADDECVICLSREDEDGVPWRQLTCGHKYHEPCLLEWLVKARRCPVCRIDLHQAYAVGSSGQSSAGTIV
mmetsp:Transcript_37284/g.73908  ORF Transcript_37284/g.73908 Transcript_37284/m.73908 type:complete len:297 (-) Transcript_37284:102-992(-)